MRIATITNATPDSNIYANPIYFWLRSFLDCVHPTNQVQWCSNIWAFNSLDEAVEQTLDTAPEIILLSIFVYNQGETEALIETIRQKTSTVKIILGGPHINGRDPLSNFDSYPEVDAVVYGDGEEAFLGIVKRWEQTGTLLAGINCAVPGEAGTYKRFKWEEWPTFTNYAGALYEEWKLATQECLNVYKNDEFGRIAVQWPTETNRGCPYGCTFCDWNAGLHHKVTIRPIEAVYAEIDAFTEVDGVVLFITDANFFQLKRDEKILEYMNKKKINYKVTAWSKLKKDKVYEYFIKNLDRVQEMVEKNYLNGQPGVGRAALQSIKKETLDAINRPEIPWIKHKQYIQEYIKTRHHQIATNAEIINDLPLMTDYDYLWQVLELYDAGIETIGFYNWEFLPNAPVNNSDYLDKWNLTVIDQITVWGLDCIKNTRQPDYSKINYHEMYQSKIVVDRTRKHPNSFGTITHQLLNWCHENKKDFKKEVSMKLDFMLSLNGIIDKQIKNQYTPGGQLLWGLYNPMSKNISEVGTTIQLYFSLYSKNPNILTVKHEQRDAMHELVKQYVPYHKYTKLFKEVS